MWEPGQGVDITCNSAHKVVTLVPNTEIKYVQKPNLQNALDRYHTIAIDQYYISTMLQSDFYDWNKYPGHINFS